MVEKERRADRQCTGTGRRSTALIVGLILTAVTAGSQEPLVERLDREALQAMSREERREYMRSYREARLEEARAAGLDQGPAGYHPLSAPRQVAERRGGLGTAFTIQYDSGSVTGTVVAADLGRFVGNRFDSALNPAGTACCFPVDETGSITMITFDMVRTFENTVTWSLYSNIMGTSARQVTSMIIPVAKGLNTYRPMTMGVTTPMGGTTGTMNEYRNGAFLAGIWQFQVMSTAIGVDSNEFMGQGFHVVSINDPQTGDGDNGMGLAALGDLNAVFRVSGVATPVELLSFDIED